MFPLLVCIALLAAQPTSPLPGTPAGNRRAKIAEGEQRLRDETESIEKRAARIDEELAAMGDRAALPANDWAGEWAGSYYTGDGLDMNVRINLAPRSGLAYTLHGCVGLYDGNHGEIVEMLPDGLRVKLAIDPTLSVYGYMSERLYFVRWGEKHLLVPEAQMVGLCNAINAGRASGDAALGGRGNPLGVPMLDADRDKPAHGRPALPAQYAALVREKPVTVIVHEIDPPAKREVTGGVTGTETSAVLDGGAAEGVYKGLEFRFGGVWGGTLTITEVDQHSSRGRYIAFADPAQQVDVPQVGDRLSTDHDMFGIIAHGAPQDVASGSLLIVAPRAFHDALADFVTFKQSRIPTELVSLEDALKAGRGEDDAGSLKRYLWHRWLGGPREPAAFQPKLRYLLLVGDADVLPVRYMVLDRNTDAAFNYAFYPSDLYYADLVGPAGNFQNWNNDMEGFHVGYFGEVCGEHNKDGPINRDQIDYLPDIAVGRWPVSTPEQVKILADKTMAYEKNLTTPAAVPKPTAALLAVEGWIDNRGLVDALGASLGNSWSVHKLHSGTDTPPTAAAVVEQLNTGARLILHSGHGEPDAWAGSFGVADLPKLTNAAAPAIILSAGCSTAYFAALGPYEPYLDNRGVEHKGTNLGEVFTEPPPPPACYQKGPFNHTGLGERLLRDGPTGAVAYFGCNTGSQPCGMTLLAGFAEALGAPSPSDSAAPLRLGDCYIHAVMYYHEHEHLADLKPNTDWYPPSIYFQGMKFMLFGDPSIPIR